MTYVFTLAVLDYSDTVTIGPRRTVTVWTPRQTILTRLYDNIDNNMRRVYHNHNRNARLLASVMNNVIT